MLEFSQETMNRNTIKAGENQWQWESTVRRLIVGVAILCTLAPPILYLLFSLREQKISMGAEAEILASSITDQINKNPEYWHYEDIHFYSILRHRLNEGNSLEQRQLFDSTMKIVAESNDTLLSPLLSVEVRVFDAGDPVGFLRITRSIRHILQLAVFVLLASGVCGALIYYFLHLFPLKVLRSAFTALHAEQEQANVTLQSLADAVITTDSSLRIISLNSAAAQMAGVESSLVKGAPFCDNFRIVHPDTREKIENLLDDCLQYDKKHFRLREQVILERHGDSREFQLEITVSPLRDEKARLSGLVIVLHDVTSSRELEEKLRAKVLELVVIVKYAGVGITFIKDDVVQEVNTIASELIGSPQEAIIGQSLSSLLSSFLGYTESLDRINQLLACGEVIDIEYQVVRPDRKRIWLRLIGQAVDPDRLKEGGSVWIAQNITGLKQHQEQLRKAKIHAEAASNLKTEFLSHVSHELRSPMSGILGMNRLVLDTDLSPVQRQYLTIVQTTSESLLLLINNLLDLSKIEAGVMELEKRPIEISSVFDYVNNIMALMAKEKGLSLGFSISEDVPQVLIGDELRLGQILLNLVGNAIKFTASGGIEVLCEKLSESESTVQLRFKVVDTGGGIDEPARKKIFDAFVQASSSVARTHGGSGLGLSICKKLTELMDGDIEVESEPGAGATFTFTASFNLEGCLQIETTTEGEKVTQHIELRARRFRQVLLVEDIPFNQTIAKLILENEAYSTQVVANGREALVALAESTFDVIFMDIQMPVMNGLMATRLIRRCEMEEQALAREDKELVKAVSSRIYGKHIPIIAMTGDATEVGKSECFAAGMDYCLFKPYDRTEMLQILDVACEEYPPSAASCSDKN